MLTIRAINLAGATITFAMPLVDFTDANEGPPTAPDEKFCPSLPTPENRREAVSPGLCFTARGASKDRRRANQLMALAREL
jgi:hypothetical protein